MRKARIIIPGRIVMVTRSCAEQRFLLRPDPDTVHAWKFSLGLCQMRYDAPLHEFETTSNHQHLLQTLFDEFPDFQRDFNSLVARSLNARWGNTGPFWGPNPYHLQEACDEEAAVKQAVYVVNNVVKHGLVRSPSEWEGPTSHRMEYGDEEVIERPDFFFSNDTPKQVRIRLTRPDIRRELTDRALRGFIREAARLDQGNRIAARRAENRRFLGMNRVMGQKRRASATSERPFGRVAPDVNASTDARRRVGIRRRASWQAEYRKSRDAHRAGRPTAFPYGTYKLRREYNVPLDAPPAWALESTARCEPGWAERMIARLVAKRSLPMVPRPP